VNSAAHILATYWGFNSFRPLQEDIINAVLDGKDTVALLPTGGGKSICFQIPALIEEGICIVVSPLVALMTDQVKSLQEKGIKALCITGGISLSELSTLLDNGMYGNYKFLYLSPERLQQEVVQNSIRQMNVNLIAVDEAHCISQWGNDFRPAYKNIISLRVLHPLVPIIALTATATPEVLADTISELNLELPAVFKKSFIRSNLAYQVQKEEDKLYRIGQLLKNNNGSAIVYVRSRQNAISTSEHLKKLGITATFYHGGINKEDKIKRLEQWKKGVVSTMVATNAFGMGIDHPNVRFVIHIQLPDSLESYFQEAGRAGRDGNYARAIILWNDYDKVLVKKQFIDGLPSPKFLKKLYRKLSTFFQISYGEGVFTQHSFNFTDFCQKHDFNPTHAYNGLNSLDRLGVIQLSKEFGRKSILRFVTTTENVLDFFKNDTTASVIGKTILRIYGGIFDSPTQVNLDLVIKKTGQSLGTVIAVLEKMQAQGLLELSLRVTDASITFLKPREDDRTINVFSKEIDAINQKKKDQVRAVIHYIENGTQCKNVQLVRYFGENDAIPCGVCSVCSSQETMPSEKEIVLISKEILLVLEEGTMNSRSISEKSTFAETKIIHVLRLLVDTKKIVFTSKNEYNLA